MATMQEYARRPDPANWSVTEIICHLRDVEELFLTRFLTILAVDEPKILAFGAPAEALKAWHIGDGVGHPLDPDRWALERQYHTGRGRMTIADFAASLAGHDDNHIDQLRRALQGKA